MIIINNSNDTILNVKSSVNNDNMNKVVTPTILPSDTYLNMYNVIKNAVSKTKNINGWTASITPAPVATALPPLNFKKIE